MRFASLASHVAIEALRTAAARASDQSGIALSPTAPSQRAASAGAPNCETIACLGCQEMVARPPPSPVTVLLPPPPPASVLQLRARVWSRLLLPEAVSPSSRMRRQPEGSGGCSSADASGGSGDSHTGVAFSSAAAASSGRSAHMSCRPGKRSSSERCSGSTWRRAGDRDVRALRCAAD